MKITALVENKSHCELKPKHGLSLYIETKNHKILFDLGPNHTLFENAKQRNIDLSLVDTVIISHGHLDHGGALGQFLEINHHAKVYVQAAAFEPHYTKVLGIRFPCGIKKTFKNHPQVVLLHGDHKIDDELSLYTVTDMSQCWSSMNNALYEGKHLDHFEHEHHLLIQENENVLIMGCGHSGVVNIMNRMKEFHPTICVGGYHLMNPNSKKSVPTELLDQIIEALKAYPDTHFYTCHCTGDEAFEYLSQRLEHMNYLSCGESIEC